MYKKTILICLQMYNIFITNMLHDRKLFFKHNNILKNNNKLLTNTVIHDNIIYEYGKLWGRTELRNENRRK